MAEEGNSSGTLPPSAGLRTAKDKFRAFRVRQRSESKERPRVGWGGGGGASAAALRAALLHIWSLPFFAGSGYQSSPSIAGRRHKRGRPDWRGFCAGAIAPMNGKLGRRRIFKPILPLEHLPWLGLATNLRMEHILPALLRSDFFSRSASNSAGSSPRRTSRKESPCTSRMAACPGGSLLQSCAYPCYLVPIQHDGRPWRMDSSPPRWMPVEGS